jgi:hypothetical protein
MPANDTKSCPLSQQQLIDSSFMEARTKILDIAAFLDRLDRSVSTDGAGDFRLVAMRRAMDELTSAVPGRVERVLLAFSDQNTDLLDELDRKAAYGASIR